MKVAAIIPVKTFDRAKSRLGLGRDKTTALCTLMLNEVLSALDESSAISSILIVSREPAAESAASKFGAEIIRDDHESGVNDAVALASKHHAAEDFDGLLVVPQDIPLLMPSDVDTLVRLSGTPPCITIVPSRLLDGLLRVQSLLLHGVLRPMPLHHLRQIHDHRVLFLLQIY